MCDLGTEERDEEWRLKRLMGVKIPHLDLVCIWWVGRGGGISWVDGGGVGGEEIGLTSG